MGQAPSVEEAIQVKAPDEQPLSLPAKTILTGVSFSFSLPIVQYAGKLCRISCSTPFLGPAFGTASVVLCSASSVQFANHVERMFCGGQENNSSDAVQLVIPALIGLASFKALGGKCRNLLPSDVRFPGVYAKLFLPSRGTGYASVSQKFLIRNLFKQTGCHHCGRKTGECIADHMPPNAIHLKSRRILRVSQKYYPQCIPCMKVQSVALRHGSNPLVLHRKSGWPEPYIFSGFLLAALQPDVEDLKDEFFILVGSSTQPYQDMSFKTMFDDSH